MVVIYKKRSGTESAAGTEKYLRPSHRRAGRPDYLAVESVHPWG
jgi:hypothetical protein